MSYGRGPPEIKGMTSLKVDNLTYRTTPDDLRRYFKSYGEIGDIYIPRDRFSRESRGFAFIRFFDRRDAEDAMDAMDGKRIDGRELRVQMARYGRPETPPYRQRRRRSRSRSRSKDRRRRRSRSRSREHRRSNRSRSRSRSRASRSRSKSGSKSRSRSKSGERPASKSPAQIEHENGVNAREFVEKVQEERNSRDGFEARFRSYSRSRSRSESVEN